MRLLPVFVLAACAVTRHPMVPAEVPPPSGTGWAAVVDGVAVVHEPVVSARWAVARVS